jgi:hypothetical protein
MEPLTTAANAIIGDAVSDIRQGFVSGAAAISERMLEEKDQRIKSLENEMRKKDSSFNREKAEFSQQSLREKAECAREKQDQKDRLQLLKNFILGHTTCVGCNNQFNNRLYIPYILTCGHTVCSTCFFEKPVITDEEKETYVKYKKDLKEKGRNGDRTWKNWDWDLFTDSVATKQKFVDDYDKKSEEIAELERQSRKPEGTKYEGKCPKCGIIVEGIRYDVLSTFSVVKDMFAFGKRRARKSVRKIKKRKSARKSKKRKSARKSKKSARKSKKSVRKSKKRKSVHKNRK